MKHKKLFVLSVFLVLTIMIFPCFAQEVDDEIDALKKKPDELEVQENTGKEITGNKEQTPVIEEKAEESAKKVEWKIGKAYLEIYHCDKPTNLPNTPTIRTYWNRALEFHTEDTGKIENVLIIEDIVQFFNRRSYLSKFIFYFPVKESGFHKFNINASFWTRLSIENQIIIEEGKTNYKERSDREVYYRSADIELEKGIYKITFDYFTPVFYSYNKGNLWASYFTVMVMGPQDKEPHVIQPIEMLLKK